MVHEVKSKIRQQRQILIRKAHLSLLRMRAGKKNHEDYFKAITIENVLTPDSTHTFQ